MKQLTVLLTGLQVLAHSVFGCCAHEDRAYADCIRDAYCHRAADSTPCEHLHPHRTGSVDGTSEFLSTAGGNQNSDPWPEHQCPHDACQWIVQKDAAPVAGQLIHLAYLPADFRSASCAVVGPAAAYSPDIGHRIAPPVRLHLRVGVLLI